EWAGPMHFTEAGDFGGNSAIMSNDKQPPIAKTAFPVCALYVGERIDLRSFAKSPRVMAQQPVTLPLDGNSMVMLYRFGAAVFLDSVAADQTRFISTLGSLIEQPYKRPESEEVSICVSAEKKEGMEDGTTVILREASVERLQIVAAALGKSVALAQYETDIG